MHFELHFDGKHCWLRDLNSTNGTLHNGTRTVGGRIADGDLIAAGRTRFFIALKDVEVSAPATTMENTRLNYEPLLHVLSTELQPLYAVLDMSQGPEVLKHLLDSKQGYMWLLDGEDAGKLMPFSPVLVSLPSHSPLLETLIRAGWAKHWGIFLNSYASLDQLWHFCRWMLIAISPDESMSMLRFYDPRVLRSLLPECTATQLQQLFSVVRYYITEGASADEALGFSLTQQGLQRTVLSLSGKPTGTSIEQAAHGWSIHTHRFAITPEQAQLLRENQCDAMPENVLAQLCELRPALLEKVGERRLRFLSQSACERAPKYGVRSQADILRYLLLQIELGSHFDVDPAIPWAAQILRMRLKPSEKLSRLTEKASALSANKPNSIENTNVVPIITAKAVQANS